jgi:hypothetical protein
MGTVHRGICVGLLLLFALASPTLAVAGGPDKTSKGHRLIDSQRVGELKQRAVEIRERLSQQSSTTSNGQGGMDALETRVGNLETSMTTLLNTDSTLLTTLQAAQAQITALQTRIAALESQPAGGGGGGVAGLDKYLTIDLNPINGVNGPNLVFKGVNVHFQSGSGATVDTTTGLGNVIIGYNETDPTVAPVRTGAHNLVGGQMNSFSSSGGLVFGVRNAIRGQYAAVLSGERNVASGVTSSVLGGGQNTASGQYSTVIGGQLSIAPSPYTIQPALQAGGG